MLIGLAPRFDTMTYQISPLGTWLAAVLRSSVLACGIAAASGAYAATDPFSWKFSGFGTLGAVHASTRSADFTSTVLRANGAGATERWSPDVDSRLGAQLDVSRGPWSTVLQVVSEQDLEGSYRPNVEWANVKYQVTPDLAVRLGRIALPVFLAADYRKIGYVLPWVRTPVEVYGSLPLSSSDGVDATWRWSAGSLRNATQVFYGRTDTRLYEERRLKARGIAGLSHSIEQGALSARMSALTGVVSMDIGNELFTAMRAFGPQGVALAEHYAIESKRVVMLTGGFTYDPGQWFVSAEIGRARTRSLLGRTTSMYAGGGYRFGDLTPYLGYAKVRADSATTDQGLNLAGLPPRMGAIGAMLNAGLNVYLSATPIQSSVSTGVRWDVMDNVALKAQYDRLRPTDGSRGTLINQRADFRSGQTVHVASFALDFVF
ncbi:hypothetical protein [Massilia consociata]|uniref:Porin n=1 Tax=Massilia consociata TaxID=760117 RepID=A0ABV6FGF8_9BURK